MIRRRREALRCLDAHNDGIILREARGDPMDFAAAAPRYHADLRRMRKGGIAAAFVMVGDSHLRQSLRMIDAIYAMAAAHPRDFAVCLNQRDVLRAMKADRFALVMSIEGQAMFGEDARLLRNWHRLGVRVASLTHGEGCSGGRRHALQEDGSFSGSLTPVQRETLRRQSKGLTRFAREALAVMAELKMPCDLAHANDAAFWEALEVARGPVCYTHGACYALCQHSRNLTDEMMKALARRRGVMGICFYRNFIASQDATLELLVEHFLHALEVLGPEGVGLGTDFDGLPLHETPLIEDAGQVGQLWEALEKKGVDRPTLEKVAYRNFLRLLPE
jgi:membrane dipeptidase